MVDSEQPCMPSYFDIFPAIPVVGHKVRLHQDDGWFFEGKVRCVANGYVHVTFPTWSQSWAIQDVCYTVENFQLVIVPLVREIIAPVETISYSEKVAVF